MTYGIPMPDAYSKPIDTWIKPCVAISMTDSPWKDLVQESVETDLPSWDQWQALCDQYFQAVDPIAHLLLKHPFERKVKGLYERLWQGARVQDSMKALVLAVCLVAVVSMPPLHCQKALGIDKPVLMEHYRRATEKQLQRCDVLEHSTIEFFQAAVIYLVW